MSLIAEATHARCTLSEGGDTRLEYVDLLDITVMIRCIPGKLRLKPAGRYRPEFSWYRRRLSAKPR